MRNRIEVLKGAEWVELYLGEEKSIKYNAVANRIGSISKREISHTNTFSLPYVHQNIQALNINVFSPTILAKSFNTKYLAKYYVKDTLLQEGYLIINNTDGNTINVNFIDSSLGIIDKWASMSFLELLSSETIPIPEPYKSSLLEMRTYDMSKIAVLTPLTNMVGRNYPIAKFPNNLNAIGDKFQRLAEGLGVRQVETFNPYQSRPIFNTKALFDIAIESFGYTPYYDDSIDWEKLEQTYVIEKGLSQSEKGNIETTTTVYPSIDSNTAYSYANLVPGYISVNFTYPNEVNALYPNQVLPSLIKWEDFIDYGGGSTYSEIKNWRDLDRCLLKPSQNNFTTGSMIWEFNTINEPVLFLGANDSVSVGATAWYENTSPGYEGFPIAQDIKGSGVVTQKSFGWNVVITVPKSQLGIRPVDTPISVAGEFLGVTFTSTVEYLGSDKNNVVIRDLKYTEVVPAKGLVVYDINDQYDSEVVNLIHAAPSSIPIKEVLSAIMEKEGILISFNNRQKTIKLFSYSSYITRRNEGNYSDWSDYLLRYDAPNFNTDYGNEYAIINDLGLSSPYKGNTYKLILSNQITGSKYQPYVQKYNSKLKDIENVKLIANPITPYFEYTNKGLGLVEVGNNLGQLIQISADGIPQGNFTGLCSVLNVNYADIPDGVVSWFSLIDRAVRCSSKFLLPLNVIKELKLEEPIYINDLGGFYIIEEVEEYIDAQTPVNVKLIKLPIDDFVEPLPNVPHFSSLHFSPLHFST